MKYVLAVLLLICAASTAHSQRPCTLKLSDAPEVRGFKLGMSETDIRPKFPRMITLPADEIGMSRLRLSKYDLRADEREGVERATVTFLDGKIATFTIIYDSATKWASVDEFARATAEGLKLTAAWTRDGELPDMRVVECEGFNVGVELLAGTFPTLSFEQKGLSEELKKRRAEAEEKRRKKFKP